MTFSSALYAIVDPPVAGGRDPVELAETFLAAGVRTLQLRWKGAPTAALVDLARAIGAAARHHGALFLVNDRADVARTAQADGVHLGQDDIPVEAARAVLGPDHIVGVSTHDLEQARRAERDGADYIGFGPLFPTGTKESGLEPRGPGRLAEVVRAVRCPVVAIGGIRADRLPAVLDTGAAAAAMISALVPPREPVGPNIARLLEIADARR